MANMTLDLQMNASNFEVFNAKRTKESLVYGKLNVDFNSRVKGRVDALVVRGNMNILGSSDFTYILKDSPLTVEDRLGETVTFVNFNDTTDIRKRQIPTIPLGGIDLLMTLHIDEAVQCKVDLNENGSNYMLVEGGGDLSFQYTPEGTMVLNGRYSLMSGEMKYEMPIIPLKTFHIRDGSYIEWTGNVMNPNLNIKASERVRASVAQEGQASRTVNFDVGVSITNRLENLGFLFTLEAPDDGSVQNELASMSAEERNKLAVTMLVTGMYLAEGNTAGSSGFDANSALNSFLQSEINNIAGSALKASMSTSVWKPAIREKTVRLVRIITSSSQNASGTTVSALSSAVRSRRVTMWNRMNPSSTTFPSNTVWTTAEPDTSRYSTTRTTKVSWKVKSLKPEPVSCFARR
mgnify:CR=1 FL=1